jgi:hypothetical protein
MRTIIVAPILSQSSLEGQVTCTLPCPSSTVTVQNSQTPPGGGRGWKLLTSSSAARSRSRSA